MKQELEKYKKLKGYKEEFYEEDDGINYVLFFNKLKELLFRNKKLIIITTCVTTLIGAVAGGIYTANTRKFLTIVRLDYEGISKGKNIDGSPFNKYDLLSEVAFKELYVKYDLDSKFDGDVDKARNKLFIEGIVPDNIKTLADQQLKAGNIYNYIPTQYVIGFKYPDKSVGKKFIDELVAKSIESYKAKYKPNSTIDKLDASPVTLVKYDYLELAEIFKTKIEQVQNKLIGLEGKKFNTTSLGYDLDDLKAELYLLKSIEIETYRSFVIMNNLSKDATILRISYGNKIREAELEKQSVKEKANYLQEVTKSYKPTDKQILFGGSGENVKLNNVDEYYSNLVNEYKNALVKTSEIDAKIREYKSYLNELRLPTQKEATYLDDLAKTRMMRLNIIVKKTNSLLDTYYQQEYTDLIENNVPTYMIDDKKGKLITLLGLILGFMAAVAIAFVKEQKKKDRE